MCGLLSTFGVYDIKCVLISGNVRVQRGPQVATQPSRTRNPFDDDDPPPAPVRSSFTVSEVCVDFHEQITFSA